MNPWIVVGIILFMLAVPTILVVSACMLSSKISIEQEIERRFFDLEDF